MKLRWLKPFSTGRIQSRRSAVELGCRLQISEPSTWIREVSMAPTVSGLPEVFTNSTFLRVISG